jgi:hypothetical protein
MITYRQRQIAFRLSATVFVISYAPLLWMEYSGTLLSFADTVPGMRSAVEFGLVATPAIAIASLTYIVISTVSYFWNFLRKPDNLL